MPRPKRPRAADARARDRGSEPDRSSGAHSSNWFLPLVTLIVLGVTAAGVVSLADLSKDRIQTAALLNRVEAEANELLALEHEAIAARGIDGPVGADMVHVRGEVEEALEQLQESPIHDAWAGYRRSADVALEALSTGRIAEAVSFGDNEVDPAFDRLHEAIEHEIDHQAELAKRWDRAADIGTFALALLAAGLLGALFHRYHRAQRRHHDDLLHDPLTRLPNRSLFQDRLRQALARTRRSGTTLAVMFIDLDRFKVINDSVGHSFGDRLLVAVARRLESAVREGDTVARFGGDEFAVLCEGIDGEDSVIPIAERIIRTVALPFDLSGHETFTMTSVGVAISTGNEDWEELLRDADVAMYRAKDQGGNRYEFFDRSLRERLTERLDIEKGLRQALARNELELHYQPEIDLRTGGVTGAEALLRWRRPGHGLAAPMEFIPIAEETGMIVPIGSWVLEEACRQSVYWQSQNPGRERLSINVNVSARQLAQSDFPELVAEIVKTTGIEPHTLCLEITESVFMTESDRNARVLDALRDVGVRIAIDDFGTGYSSLGYLKRFQVDVIKIDRSFVREVAHDPKDSGIVAAVVDMANAFGITATAEGIETEEQLSRLRALGCHAGQGYLFARPQPAEAVEELLERAMPVGQGASPVPLRQLAGVAAGRRRA